MAEKDTLEPSLLEQIIAETFKSLKESEAFDADTLLALRELAAAGKLSKASAVEKVIKNTGARHETA